MFKGCAIVLIGSWACKWHLDKNVRVYAFNTQRGVSEHSSRMHVLVHMAHWALWPLFIVFGWMKYSGKNVHCFNSLTDISCLLITCSSSEIFHFTFAAVCIYLRIHNLCLYVQLSYTFDNQQSHSICLHTSFLKLRSLQKFLSAAERNLKEQSGTSWIHLLFFKRSNKCWPSSW